MQAAAEFLHQPRQDRRSATPLTERSTFTITELDVGSAAVRPGIAAQLEQERDALLLAAKAIQKRIKNGTLMIGAGHEAALEAAIRLAEAGK